MWMSEREASRYFGTVDRDELERICLEYDLEVEVDDEGYIDAVLLDDKTKYALFELHRESVGHRPDDPQEVERAIQTLKRRNAALKGQRHSKKRLLQERVNARLQKEIGV